MDNSLSPILKPNTQFAACVGHDEEPGPDEDEVSCPAREKTRDGAGGVARVPSFVDTVRETPSSKH